MTTIYVDTLFLLNAVVDYLLLLCSARLAGEPLERLRFAGAAALGGGYAVALFLPGWEFLYHPLCRVSAAVLMVLTAFARSRRLLRQAAIFFALACAFGGGVLAVGLLGGQGLTLGGGVFYSAIDLKTVLVSAAGCYGGLSLCFRNWGRHSAARGELKPVRLEFSGRTLELTALMDTGNTLTDPVTGRRVLVAEGACLAPLFPEAWKLDGQALLDPAAGLERFNSQWPGRFRLIPYRAVGTERGLLLAARLDRVEVDGEEQAGALVALSPNPVSDGGSYQVLAGVG